MASELVWAVKKSFVAYILGSAGGSVAVEDGATGDATGPFRFPGEADAGLPTPGGEPLRFRGSVHFRGHGGLLDLPVTDPWIESHGDRHLLTIQDPDDAAARVSFVSIAGWDETADGYRGGTTALTLDGSDLFFGPYSEGTEFDAPVVSRVDA